MIFDPQAGLGCVVDREGLVQSREDVSTQDSSLSAEALSGESTRWGSLQEELSRICFGTGIFNGRVQGQVGSEAQRAGCRPWVKEPLALNLKAAAEKAKEAAKQTFLVYP